MCSNYVPASQTEPGASAETAVQQTSAPAQTVDGIDACTSTVTPLSPNSDRSVPNGDAGADADRDPHTGRFTKGNRGALVTGARSIAFWNAQEAVRRDIVEAVISDAGHTSDNAPRALQLAADGIAQAVLVRDSAFARMVESGGPLTRGDRPRRAFVVWQSALDRLERHLRLVGLERKTKDITRLSVEQYLEQTKGQR
jgi:hypothetical protein